MKGAPVVSVVMPLYNKQVRVGRSVRSVLEQTRAEFELIVVNDGSTDGSRGVVAQVRDQRVRLIDQENAGVSAARNRGVREARAELIAFCDADDEWKPEHLADILGLAERFPDADVFATGYFIGDGEGRLRPNIIRGLPVGFEEGRVERYFSIAARSDPPLTASSVGVTRRALHAVGLFPPGVASGEDLLTWARLAERFRIALRRRPTAIFWQPRGIADRPGRVPAEPDLVAEELGRMLARARGRAAAGLGAYLALWHRMRGVIYLRLGNARCAREEFARAMSRGRWSLKLCALWLLCLVPQSGVALERAVRLRSRLRGSLR